MRLPQVLVVALMFVGAGALAQELPTAPRKQFEQLLQEKFFKEAVQIDPDKTRFNPKSHVLFVTVEVLTPTAESQVNRAIRDSGLKSLVFKDAGGAVLVAVPLDRVENKVGFNRTKLKKGESVDFRVTLPDEVDVTKIREVTASK